MTWEDVKLATLQKMFAANGTNIVVDESTTDYLAAMPQACNEALQMLSTAGKYLTKSVQFANNPIENILSDQISKYIIQINETKEYTCASAKSYSFSFTGQGVLTITVGAVETVVNLPKTSYYVTYNGLIDNDDEEDVIFSFEPTYPSALKDFGVYAVSFESTDDIPTFKKMVKFNMKDEVSDFYQIDNEQVYFEGSDGTSRYIKSSSFFQEGNSVFVIDREQAGNYTLYYKAYPTEISQSTEDSYVLPLDPEVAVLLPLYMASQLYKDDDNALATVYRNEFEVAFSRLTQKANVPSAARFESESGWI